MRVGIPAFALVEMEERTLDEIKRELEAATERRTALWHELSIESDPEKIAEIAELNERIESLWSDARAARTRERFGAQETILKRARAEERLERDLPKVA
jgi:hypothetical protein